MVGSYRRGPAAGSRADGEKIQQASCEEGGRKHKEESIEASKETAMPGKDAAHVLAPKIPFEHRFTEVPKRGCKSPDNAKNES